MRNIIEVNNLTKTFNDKKALNNINLTITNTGLTALLGPSGSGKSTLLRHLSGLVFADKSEHATIKVFGDVIQSRALAVLGSCYGNRLLAFTCRKQLQS